MNAFEFARQFAASGATLLRGIAAVPAAAKPAVPVILYDIEACPYCRLVREALTRLDLDADIRPCPRGGLRFRPLVREMTGKEQFPFLVDPNTGVAMHESADIIEYLEATYGGHPPSLSAARAFVRRRVHLATSFTASAMRAGRGLFIRSARAPDEALELWSFEASPFARAVREVLCELEIPYRLHNTGRTQWQDWLTPAMRESLVADYLPQEENRVALLARAGKVQVPYLVDPNTGTELFESTAIIDYLRREYGR